MSFSAIDLATKPIRGVMQASMVLKDNNLLSLSFEDWQTAVAPKVQGTWNLHEVLLETQEPLDFFVLFSSWSGLVGHWGQANYAAGNTFLDSFAQYRQSMGLPCAAVDIEVVEDVGYVSRNARTLEHFHTTSTHVLFEQDVLDSLQLLIERSPALVKSSTSVTNKSSDQDEHRPAGKFEYVHKGQLSLGLRSTQSLDAPSNRTIWKRDPRMALYRNIESHEATVTVSENEQLRQFLAEASRYPTALDTEDSAFLLAREIGKTLFSFMLRDEEGLDIQQGPAALGVDSLVAIELHNWFRHTLGVDMTTLKILGAGSLLELGQMAAQMLKTRLSPDSMPAAVEEKEGNEKYLGLYNQPTAIASE